MKVLETELFERGCLTYFTLKQEMHQNLQITCVWLEKSCHVRLKAHGKGMVATVSSSAVVEIKRLLFVLCTVIIGHVGEQKEPHLTLDPQNVAREEGVFLVPRRRKSEQTENGSILLPPLGFTKQFREKQNLVVFFHLFKPFTVSLLVLILLQYIFLFQSPPCTEMSLCALKRNLLPTGQAS